MYFEEGIDVSSILPIFCTVLKKDGEIKGVLEFVMKKKVGGCWG